MTENKYRFDHRRITRLKKALQCGFPPEIRVTMKSHEFEAPDDYSAREKANYFLSRIPHGRDIPVRLTRISGGVETVIFEETKT